MENRSLIAVRGTRSKQENSIKFRGLLGESQTCKENIKYYLMLHQEVSNSECDTSALKCIYLI